ncbi:MAG TPA: universal stress protein [Candidatus Cloacimonadota bacterium]|nr:universal stress protein [Candidatus Cloacimonadota bacterium]
MKRILTAIDLNDETNAVISQAIKITKLFGASLCIVHCESYDYYQTLGETDVIPQPEFREGRLQIIRERLKKVKDLIQQEGIEVKSVLLEGPTAENIISAAEDFQAELIIVGSHKHGKFYNLLIGSTHDALIKRSKVPVLVIPPLEEK